VQYKWQPKYRQAKMVTKGYAKWELEESYRPKLFYMFAHLILAR
jgi:hypothetical protein